jgi:hypothetical protein
VCVDLHVCIASILLSFLDTHAYLHVQCLFLLFSLVNRVVYLPYHALIMLSSVQGLPPCPGGYDRRLPQCPKDEADSGGV